MIKIIFQKILLPIIIAAVFGGGGFFVKSCQNKRTITVLNKQISSQHKNLVKYVDSVQVLKRDLASCQTDSSIMKGQINGIQKVDLALRNGNIRLKTELNDCEENMKKAIETGIVEVKQKQTFIQKLFKRK